MNTITDTAARDFFAARDDIKIPPFPAGEDYINAAGKRVTRLTEEEIAQQIDHISAKQRADGFRTVGEIAAEFEFRTADAAAQVFYFSTARDAGDELVNPRYFRDEEIDRAVDFGDLSAKQAARLRYAIDNASFTVPPMPEVKSAGTVFGNA